MKELTATAVESTASPSRSWFVPVLLGVCALGLVLRLFFALAVVGDRPVKGDARVFHDVAENLVGGRGYSSVTIGSPKLRATAGHPPMMPLVLAAGDVVGIRSVGLQRAFLSFVAAAGILLVGLVGRRLAGDRVGIVAAATAAIHPLWIQPSGVLMSEAVYLVVIP